MTSQPRSGAQGGGGGDGEGGYIKRVTGDEREDEMDKNLQLVGEREEGMAVKITHTHTHAITEHWNDIHVHTV